MNNVGAQFSKGGPKIIRSISSFSGNQVPFELQQGSIYKHKQDTAEAGEGIAEDTAEGDDEGGENTQ